MKLEHEFTVVAPIEETWAALLDVERVAGCLPGATVRPAGEDGVYDGQMKLKLGPMTVAYKGTLRLDEVDEAARRAVMAIQASELKGQGGATARMENRLVSDGDGRTRVVVGTDLDVSGRAAQLGRGMMENVADRMLGDFARRLERELAATRDGGGEAAETDTGGTAPASGAASSGDCAPAADDALDLGAGALGLLAGRERALALGVVAVVAVLLAARRRRPRIVVSLRSGLLGRRAEVRLG